MERWLLITLSTSGPSSTLRVHAWRKLRSLGALAVAQSVYLVPDRPAPARVVNRLLTRVRREGGRGRVLHIALDSRDEHEVIASFCAERTDEYGEIVGRTREFLAEIEMERARGRATYTEVEESDADLARLQKWLTAVRQRDYFGADGRESAAAAVDACEQALTDFESEAYEREAGGEDTAPANGPALRAVEAETRRRT